MGTIKPSVRYTHGHNDRSQGRYQECGYVRGHANRCCRMRHSSTREIQHRKGHCSLYQKRIRQKIQPNMALHCRTQLWIVRYPRDETLYLLLSWTGRHSPLQVWIEQNTMAKAEQLYPYSIAILKNGNTRYVSLTINKLQTYTYIHYYCYN